MFLREVKSGSFWLENIITVLIYISLGLISNLWTIPNQMAGPLWLPAGFALAMILWWGYRILPGVFIGEFTVIFLLGDPSAWQTWLASLAISSGAVLQATAGAWIIEKYTHTKTPFYTVHDVFIFIFGVVIAVSTISATIATIALLTFNFINLDNTLLSWYIWWMGNVVGIIVVTPIVMVWYKAQFIFDKKQWGEFIILLFLLGVILWIIHGMHRPATYVLLPFCIWAAVRLGPRLAIITTFITAFSILWIQIHTYTEFQGAAFAKSLVFLQMYVAVLFFTTLVLLAVLTERKKAQNELIKTNLELEERVVQRTKDLAEKNVALNTVLTELKQAETQLIQAEKMSSLGVLTAGIAHEINNAVNFISANIIPLKNDVEDIMLVLNKFVEITPSDKIAQVTKLTNEINLKLTIDETRDLLAGMEEGAKRTAGIVKDLRTFSRLDENELKLVNIHDNINSTLTLLHGQYQDRINIVKNFGDISEVEGFPGRLNQVFMNILTNAIHATPDKGQIFITTKQQSGNVIINIRDTGTGMSKEVREKIFEPFFTTKPVGKGTGLGLSISYSIIQDHQGTIEVSSEVGKGSEFTISLPIKHKSK